MGTRLHIDDLHDLSPADAYSAALQAPKPGSDDEISAFAALSERMVRMYRDVFPHPRIPRTVVVIPSLSLDQGVLGKIDGISHYEERMLCMLMLLRLPSAELIYVTSVPIAPATIDYFLHLLPGIPVSHARRRLHLFSCYDGSARPLSLKLLERPRLLRRIRNLIRVPESSHISCFNSTPLERSLAVRLGIPLYACDPALLDVGSKSGSRKVFMEAGVALPDGYERLHDMDDVTSALFSLKTQDPDLRRAVVKLEQGASGEGNAIFSFEGAPSGDGLRSWIRAHLPERLRFESGEETWEAYSTKFSEMGGIVERFIEGKGKRSPSMQGRITPAGEVKVVSTHDQVLGGPSGQIFLGCRFPANKAYRLSIQVAGLRIGEILKAKGVMARYGVDFVSVPRDGGWDHYAIEINIRKGGTTHPFLMLDFLTEGMYDSETGLYHAPNGKPCYYFATDNLIHPDFRGFTPEDLIDIAVNHNLHYYATKQQGVFFHLIGALSEFGKLGLLCIADSREEAQRLYTNTREALQCEATAQAEARAPFTGSMSRS